MTDPLIIQFQDTLYKIRNRIGSRKLYEQHLDELFDQILANPVAREEFMKMFKRRFGL